MQNLIYPNLFLFLYDLRYGLGETQKEFKKNQDFFAVKLPQYLRQNLFEKDSAFEIEYLPLLTNEVESFTDSDKPIEGSYYPVRLNDTYGLLLGCSFQEDRTHYPINSLVHFQNKIQQKLNNQSSNIGQTWLILAEMESPRSNPEEIAKNCCQALNLGLDWKRDLQGQGSFLGGKIFELWRYKLLMDDSMQDKVTPQTIQQLQDNIHLIIALYPSGIAAKQFGEDFNTDFLCLFNYRHKILWAYAQGLYLKQQLKKKYIDITKYTTTIKCDKIKQLQKTVVDAQTTISEYTIDLNNFAAQIRTIETNLINYTNCLGAIKEKAGKASVENMMPAGILPWVQSSLDSLNITDKNKSYLLHKLADIQSNYDLKFLDEFNDKVKDKYLLQLQKDYEYLSPGLQLLTDLINSIRTITEITQTEQDRNFQYWAGIFGVGLATAAIGVSAAIDKLDKNANDPVRSWLNQIVLPTQSVQAPLPWWFEPAIPLIYGGMLGGGVAALVALSLLVRSFGKRSHSRHKQ